jgi:hypothetical protein
MEVLWCEPSCNSILVFFRHQATTAPIMACPFAADHTSMPAKHSLDLRSTKINHIEQIFAEIRADLGHHGIDPARVAVDVNSVSRGVFSRQGSSILIAVCMFVFHVAIGSILAVLLLGVSFSDSAMFLPPVESCFEPGSGSICRRANMAQNLAAVRDLAAQGYPLVHLHSDSVATIALDDNEHKGSARSELYRLLKLYEDNPRDFEVCSRAS